MTPSETAASLQERFKEFFDMIFRDHQDKNFIQNEIPATGHDIFHTIVVAQYATLIAPNERLAVLGWIAGMCHNTDRLFKRDKVKDKVLEYLALTHGIARDEQYDILEAVLEHSKLNDPRDNPVTVTLKDADRLSGLGYLCLIRAGQCFPERFIFNPHYVGTTIPGSSYQNPSCILDCLKFTLEWKDMLRLPKAKEIAKKLCKIHQEAISFIENVIIKGLELDSFKF